MYTFLIKPTNNCNLRCKYCFINNNIKSLSNIMTIELAKIIIDQIAKFILLPHNANRVCNILWHGGEPLIWDASYYREVLSYMHDTYPGVTWKNAMQTNLTLLTDEHIQVFSEFSVRVSTSMDGYSSLHDANRIFANGNKTHSIIVEKLHKLAEKNMRSGLIVVLNRTNIDKVIEIYDYYKKYNQGFRVNPLIDTGEALINYSLSISPESYAEAMKRFFDYWINDDDAVPVHNFIEWTSALVTGVTSSCSFTENCQNQFTVIEPNGDISVCDRLCGSAEYVYGNIMKDDLYEVFLKKQKVFEKRSNILRMHDCKDCKYWNICYGGCPTESSGGLENINMKFKYCDSYKEIYQYIENYINNNKYNFYETDL